MIRINLTGTILLIFALSGGIELALPQSEALAAPEKEEAPARSKLDASEDDAEPPNPKEDADRGKTDAAEPVAEPAEDDSSAAPTTAKPARSADATSKLPTDVRLHPCDWIVVRNRNLPVKVQLLPTFLDVTFIEPKREYKFLYYKEGTTREAAIPWNISGADIKEVQYFEHRILVAAAERLNVSLEELTKPGSTWAVSNKRPASAFRFATKILEYGVDEHDSAVQRNLRKDYKFGVLLHKPLLVALYNLRLCAVDALIVQEHYLEAAKKCDELQSQFAEVDPDGLQLLNRYDAAYLRLARRAFDQAQFSEARDRLADLDHALRSRESTGAAALRREMADKARGQVKLAAEANASGDRERAAQYLDSAQEIWPELEMVDLNRQAWDKEYPILRCAYPYLPINFSPFSVQTPVEHHAASLIFESLVRWTNCADGGLYYRPCLAEDPPVPLARGRQFQLRRCEWCDRDQQGEARMYFSAEDVIWTEQLQRQNPWASAQVSQLENVSHDHGDPFRVDLLLKMDHWQPMSFMDFWILPKYRFPQGTPVEQALQELNERPVGTGPYFLAERRDDTVRFRANPRFRERGLPRIKEIQFNQMEPTVGYEQFLAGKVDMIYGIRKVHRDALAHAGKQSSLQRLNTPSVYFLAPNYAQPNTPLADSNFRLAIAHAIDREAVLNQYFRENAHDRANCQLTGPFPHDSWAYNTTVPEFQRLKSGSFLDLAKKKLGKIRTITLLYPDDDPDTEIACGRIKDDLQSAGIEIEIEPVKVREWHDRIIKRHDFDLVYWRHDFLNATYWLWPLFDPKAKDPGTNFMGYDPDPDLANLFFQLREHKRFVKIRELTNRIHEHIATNAIVIPLWQLDTYVAVGDRLHNITLDPWTLFGDVQDWSLTPARP